MKKPRWLTVFVMALLAMALIQGTALAATPSAMTVEPAGQRVGIGDSFEVDIYVTPGEPIAAGQLDLNFDPTTLQATNVAEGTFLSQSGEPVYFNDGTIDNVSGAAKDIYGVIAAPGVAVSGSASFATVTFTALAEGVSPCSISGALLGNLQAHAVPLEITDGTITVCPDWDVNLDGHQNVLGMVSIYQHFMETGPIHWIREDVNRDGAINVLDMILVGQHWTG